MSILFAPQDGLCELNTLFLIARRQWRSLRTPFSVAYWITFFPMRIFLYPYMLVLFYRELQVGRQCCVASGWVESSAALHDVVDCAESP